MMKKLILLLMVICLVGSVSAANLRYKASGDWMDVDADGTADHGWQNPTTPGTLDTARANWGGGTISVSSAVPTVNKLQAGVDEDGTFKVLNGGTLTTLSSVTIGNNNAACTGYLEVDSGGILNAGGWTKVGSGTVGVATVEGTANLSSHLWVASGAGTTGSTVNINAGGVVDVGGMIGIGTGNAVDPSGSNGTVNVAGLLTLSNIHGGGTSIQPGSVLDIIGAGQVTLPGDFVGVLQGYVDNNYITGDGIVGNVSIDLTTNPGLTTVMVIPEPATMILLGLGGLLIRRKK